MKRTPDLLATIVLLVGLALACARLTLGCTPAAGPAEAGAGFAVQQLACVDNNETKPAIDACRARVRSAWATDAGSDR